MPSDVQSDPKVEIAHVLTMDVVEYSTLLITEQTELMAKLTGIVKQSARFRRAEADGKLVRVPTGDGMLLVFFDDPQAPIECAIEVATGLKAHPEIRLRMGIHSGAVNEVVDVNDRSNVAGAGVDMAQRVMDCGDAGHILLSKRVADDLAPFPRWNPHLHDLGECEVKHGRKVSLVNFYTGEIGNSALPRKCFARDDSKSAALVSARSSRKILLGAGLGVLALGLAALGVWRANYSQTPAAPESHQTIAVLPFENASDDPSAEYLSEGISEALINSLTELQQLRVIARSTAFHYRGKDVDPKQVGRELKVAAVLTGKVRQIQDALSVQVDLVDAGTGAQLWGAAYDRKVSDVIAVKQTIAREVTEKLKLKLSGDDQRRLVKRDTTNAQAYQSYLRGRYLWNKRTPDGLKQAIAQFQQAIECDPDFALGYAGLADTYLLLQQYVGIPSSEAMPKARAAVDRALQIDDSLAEAHASSGLAYQFDWQWAKAEEEYKRAISLNPNYPTAHHWFCVYYYVTGQVDNAEREIRRAEELDPLSPIISANLAIIFLLRNEVDAAIAQCQKIIQLDPNHISGHDWLGWAYVKQQRYPEAIAEREKVAELSQRSVPQLSGLGYVYALAGRRDEALAILKELEERHGRGEGIGQNLAAVYYGLDDKDKAYALLENDFEEHSAELQHIMERVQFEPIRREARGMDLIRRMGLTPQ